MSIDPKFVELTADVLENFYKIPSITCVCIISYVFSLHYASPATAVRPVTSVRAFQHVTSYTRYLRTT